MWSELSDKDKSVMGALAECPMGKVEDIRSATGMSSGAFSVYRSRHLRRGLIESAGSGHLRFTLPHFSEFVLHYAALY